MTDIPMKETSSDSIRYVEETEDRGKWGHNERLVEVAVRDWDVSDAQARAQAALQELGADDYHKQYACWYVDTERNAATLVVFRRREQVGA